MIIGIVGKAGSGKDTAAKMIPGATVMSFAAPLKEFVISVYGIPREWVYGPSELRNTPIPGYFRPDGQPLTVRYALQTLGTEWGRNCSPDTWVRLGVRLAKGHGLAVFSDCRFVNEARAVREAGGFVWKIERPGSGLSGGAATHPSELEMDSPEMDALVTHRIDNSGTLADLERQINAKLHHAHVWQAV